MNVFKIDKKIYYFFIWFYTFLSYSQNTSIPFEKESLLNDSILAITNLERASNLKTSKLDSAQHYYINKALQLGERINNPYILSRAHNQLGLLYKEKDEWDKAILEFDKSIQSANIIDAKQIRASALSNKGIVYSLKGDYGKAIQYIQQSTRIAIKNTLKSRNMNHMALILYKQERYDEALSYFKKSVSLSKQIKDRIGIYSSYLNISALYITKNKLDSAQIYVNNAIKILEKNNDTKSLAKAYNNLAIIIGKQGNKKEALTLYLKSYKINSDIGVQSVILTQNIADIYYNDFNDYSLAKKYYLEAKETAIKTENYRELIDINESLAAIYSNADNDKLANKLLLQRIRLSDSIYRSDRDKKIAEIQEKYENEKKNKKIALQNAKLDKQSFDIKKRNFYIFSLLLSLIVLFTLFVIYRQSTKQKILNIELELQKYISQHKNSLDNKSDYQSKFGLSNREIEVLELLGKGKTYSEIGESLFISPNTVRYHIKNLYLKLDVKSKMAALNKVKS